MQDELRASINKLALRSPYPSTVNHARRLVECLDAYADAEANVQSMEGTYEREAPDAELAEWNGKAEPVYERYRQTSELLSDAAYGFQRHLARLSAHPLEDPGD